MAKYKKAAKRRFNYNSIIVLLFIFSFFGFIYSNVFVRTNNVNLNIAIQEVDAKISEARVVNESLSIDIQELATYDNIAEVAKEAGLTNQQNNVVSIRIQP
jgi:cell division protein FtsL